MYKPKVFIVVAVLIMSQIMYTDSVKQPVAEVAAGDIESNIPPLVEIVPDVSSGKAPLEVHFDGDAYDEDGLISSVEWDFEGDGRFEVLNSLSDIEKPLLAEAVKQGLQKEFTYTNPGIYHALMRATDDKGESSVSSVTIQVYSDIPWLDVTASNKEEFTYMARAGYEVFFKDDVTETECVRFQIKNAWISYQLGNQVFAEVKKAKGVPSGNQILYRNVYENIDVRYTVYEDLLLEEFIVYKKMDLSVFEQEFTIDGVEYVLHEDGSIGFYNGEALMFSIPKPLMYELDSPQNKSYGLHYEIIEKGSTYVLRKIIDDEKWLKKAKYPIVIDSSTQGEIADPWEQQGLTPYGQYFENLNEYVDPLTGHLTIRHTDYHLSGRGLDLTVTRVYSTVVAYKEDEETPGAYMPIATYQEAPTDLGSGWSLDFPWLEIKDDQPGKYLHLPRGVQVRTQFQNGVWVNETYGFTMYQRVDNTYVRYRNNGIEEEFDTEGRIISITDLNGNSLTFTYVNELLHHITDTVGRVLTFTYAGDKLVQISDGTRTITYNYSGDKLVSVQDPLGRVTTYGYLAQNSFLITGVHYPTGGFSSYEYAAILPDSGKLAPYKASQLNDGITAYYVYKVDSSDTVTWTSPQDINAVTVSSGRPCVLQRDDGSLVMYFKDKYVWTETVWKCAGGECWEEPITHTEYWIKRSISTDQRHWSTPENVVQVKSTTGNPVVIEKQDGSYIMYYKDQYVWTEQNCWLEGCPHDCQYVCETITHTEYWIYRRTSSDGLIWQSSVKFQQTVLNVRDIAVIQKQDSTYLMCYTDKVNTSYYIRQKTSSDGVTWSSPSNVILVDSQTGNPALLQRDSGVLYLAYRKGSSIYILSNSGSGWSSPVQTTTSAQGDPALLDTGTDILVIYKGLDGYFYRISSPDGQTWSSPSQMAPQKPLSSPSAMRRKDRMYRVVSQSISSSAVDLVKVTEFSYEGDSQLVWSSDVIIRDAQTLQSSMYFEYDSKGRTVERISKDAQGIQTEKIVYTYNGKNQVVRQDVHAGDSTEISYSTIMGYDDNNNIVYTKGPEGAENFYSYINTYSQNQFVDSKGVPVTLFTNQFYANIVPSDCHSLLAGQAFINNGKVQEIYHKYDLNGNLIETKTLFPTRDYAVFSGTFDEHGQTSFTFDLTGLVITDGILVISSIAVPYTETLYETHSEPGIGYQNTGVWQGKYFLADYTRCTPEPDCYDGETKIGPFEHYPGSPDYTGYTIWVENNTQYVKASYMAALNEYPNKVEFNLNSSSWTEITSNLGAGTTSTAISSERFIQGINTIQFRDSNIYFTRLGWALYINQGATPEEYHTQFVHDPYGNLTSVTDPLGHSTALTYDTHHTYLTSITNGPNTTMTTSYDFNTGLLNSVIDAKGNTTSYEYDILGRVTKKINPDLSEKEAVYNDQNNSITIYDELDHSTTCYYDGLGRLNRMEWYLSPTTLLRETYTYTYQDKVRTRVDPGGHCYNYDYDAQGRLITLVNPDSTFLEAHFDDTTNTVSVFDENQHKKEYHYNWVGRLVWVKEYTDTGNYYLTQYTYDSSGNLTSFTDGNGNTTFYSYDSLFGVTGVTYPDSSEEIFSYDAVGNLKQKTTANGTATFTYDAVNQLTSIQYQDQSQVTFVYDANGNRISMTDPEGTSACVYDNCNRLLSETRTISGNPYTVNYEYDAASRIISLTYPDQSVVTYEYDSLNRVTVVSGYAEFTYNTDSFLETMIYSNGTITTYEYSDCHRPLTIHTQKNGTDLLVMNYQYDLEGNITYLEYDRRLPDQTWLQSSQRFGYDWLNRLVSAQEGTESLSYTYDAVGNRLYQNDLAYAYNTMNELLSVSDGSVFTYDGMGNALTKCKGTDTFSYIHDQRNKLTRVEKNQHIVTEYAYDGDGRRIQKTEWSDTLQEYQTVFYAYSGGNVIYEKNIQTGKEATHVYGPTGRIVKNVDGLKQYYHRDHLGSARLITDESGNVIGDIKYEPFGKSTKSGADEENYLFTGKEKDASGLYYFGARYYDPETGRWIERDPKGGVLENPMSLNRYVYCFNNPLFYTDPDGCDPKVNNFSMDLAILSTVSGGLSFGLLFPPAGAIWAGASLLIRHWISKNFEANTKLDAQGNVVVTIYAKNDTFSVGAYFASIEIEESDSGSYKGYIRNASATLVAVAISHNGSGTLDLYLSGSGPQLLSIVGSGNINIHVGTDCTGLVTLDMNGTGIVTIFVPMGQSPPQIMGGGDYIIVYYNPDDEADKVGDEDES
jgi:RHS repeat-associated protein